MTRQRLLTDYVRDMLENTEHAQRFLKDVTFEAFLSDDQKCYAVVRVRNYR